MIRLVIDGQSVEVEEGTSLLEAARQIGRDIPTLCHVPGLPASTSCFVCAVQVEGRRTLSPSCGLPAEEGMVVETATEDVLATRKMALELLLSDHAGDCVAPCAVTCPAELDIPGFLRDLAAGEPEASMATVTEALALPGSLGRICPRLCESSCRRCDHDESLAIGALHRYVADQGNVEKPNVAPPTGRSVGIVGAGPAGLAATLPLLRAGHACTLYDAHEEPGGMLRWAIPAYRLPREPLRTEIDRILDLGAELHCGVRWGQDFDLAELRGRHDAVFLAIGAQGSRSLGCPGEELAISGLDFLREIAAGESPAIGESVLVVGGGNTAMDCARSALRLGAEVRVLYRRSREEMPCLLEEVEGAKEEGIELQLLVAPVELRPRNGVLELVVREMTLGEPDASGRRRPVGVPGTERTLRCDTVLAAVGQTVQLDQARHDGLDVTPWGLRADPDTLATNQPGVFAGGDAVLGADLAVRAVAAGRRAAASIDQYLHEIPVTGPPRPTDIALREPDPGELATILREIEHAPRLPAARLSLEARTTSFDEIEGAFEPLRAVREARRCLTCGCRKAVGCDLRQLATDLDVDPYRFLGKRRRGDRDDSHPEVVYEPGKCIQCEACVEIAERAGEPLGLTIVGRGFDVRMAVPFDRPMAEGLTRVARECARACPTGALTLHTARACDLGGCGGVLGEKTDRLVQLRPGGRPTSRPGATP